MTPRRIGLTGNIGSGKSTVAALLVQRGAVLIDSDALAREATEEPEVLEQIAIGLGEDLVRDGRLDREATAARVFADASARQILNDIVHPWVRRKTAERVAELGALPEPPPIIVMDIPLLYENDLDQDLDAVIVVDAPLEVRVGRVAQRSGLDPDEVRARDAAQMPLEKKVARADYVLDNGGDIDGLRRQIDTVWEALNS